jgi:antitoxin (DNA-binding transcriptional repressor) of toxin-antitoxin stability system
MCQMTSTGIRELKNNLSRFVRRIEAGERIAVTAHGRVVAELGPPARTTRTGRRTPFDELIAAGVVRLPVEAGDPLADWPALRLPKGTAGKLIEIDRDEA